MLQRLQLHVFLCSALAFLAILARVALSSLVNALLVLGLLPLWSHVAARLDCRVPCGIALGRAPDWQVIAADLLGGCRWRQRAFVLDKLVFEHTVHVLLATAVGVSG